MNVSEQLLSILSNEGVRHIFGVVGDALNPLVTAINRQDQVKWIGVKHEGNASFAAFAQGELTSNFGVCASTVGPGALHLVNGLYNAKKERSPVLAITGQVPVEHIGTNYHQEVNLTKIFDDICDHQAIIRSPKEAPRVILRAIRIALSRRCVCRVELPADIAEMPVENESFVHQVFRSNVRLVPGKASVLEAAELINKHDRIGILAGVGCREVKEEIIAFARKVQAPITHSLKASDIFDHTCDNVVGLTGLIGNSSGYNAVMDADLLIMLGTDFPYTDFLPTKTEIIQVDLRAESIGNRVGISCGVQADMKEFVEAVMPLVSRKKNDDFLKELRTEFKTWKEKMNAKSSKSRDMTPIHPQIFAKEISDKSSSDSIFVVDTGTSAIWAANYMDFYHDRRIIGSFNHGSMAVGLPAAIGAQLAFPERQVWGLIGDGAFNMSLQDFSTAVKYNLPIKLIVFNNSQLGFVKIEMEEAGLAPNMDALEVDNFNFADFAKLTGGDGIRVENPEDITGAVVKAIESTKPFIIDAVVTNAELSLPPKIGIHEVKNFGLSKIKELIEFAKGDERQWTNIKEEIKAYFD